MNSWPQSKWSPLASRFTTVVYPKDNKFLELAISGGATHLVTGDDDLLVLHPFRGVAIVTPQEFLDEFALDSAGELKS